MGKQIKTALMIVACSLVLAGCDVAIGPKTETRYVIVKPGNPCIILQNVKVRTRLLTDPDGDVVVQDISGWPAMPPEHWETIKNEINRLRAKCGEPSRGE